MDVDVGCEQPLLFLLPRLKIEDGTQTGRKDGENKNAAIPLLEEPNRMQGNDPTCAPDVRNLTWNALSREELQRKNGCRQHRAMQDGGMDVEERNAVINRWLDGGHSSTMLLSSVESFDSFRNCTYKRRHRFACHICGQSFQRANDFKAHQILQVFDKKRHMRNRSAYKHLQVPSEEFFCPICSRLYRKPRKFKEHLKKHMKKRSLFCLPSLGKRPFSCEFCGKSFRKFCKLHVHVMSHTQQTVFCCRRCGMRSS